MADIRDLNDALHPIDQSKWGEVFAELSQQVAKREIFASIWFEPGHMVRTIVSRLQVDAQLIRLLLPRQERRGAFCAEIAIQPPASDDGREYECARTQDGEIYLLMQQREVILALSNSAELLDFLESDAPQQ
jgi:hypothetical protein